MTTRRFFIQGIVALSGASFAQTAFAGGHGRLGKFKGASNHTTSGTAELVKSGTGGTVELLDDFYLDGAPDPKVALGKDGYDKSTLMGKLKSTSGASSYQLPDGVNPDDYNEIWIWCERFNVPLGVAKLG
ncbi:MAG: DM13 domain-containing protein [Paracoccaceae bacterium]